MRLQEQLRHTDGDFRQILELIIPGSSEAAKNLRVQILGLCNDFTARGAVILGPAGSGKSTLARVIALGRFLTHLSTGKQAGFARRLRVIPPAMIPPELMDWYVELSLTGLVEPLAASQLFGHVKGAYTDADQDKEGVFEKAMYGRTGSKDSPTFGAQVTGGVVFLDEIGDLPKSLQPKLLTILSGGRVYRLGAEAGEGYEFKGLIVAATWRNIFEEKILRQDLAARLSSHVIRIPSLSERRDDMESIASMVLGGLKQTWTQRADELSHVMDIDRARLKEKIEVIEQFRLEKADIDYLKQVPWEKYGDLRGLSQILHRALRDQSSISEALEQQEQVSQEQRNGKRPDYDDLLEQAADMLLGLIMTRNNHGRSTLVMHINHIRNDINIYLTDLLRNNQALREKIALHVGRTNEEIGNDLKGLKRDRKKK